MTQETSNFQLAQIPPEFDEAGKYAMREKAAATNPALHAFGHMSDEWVADRVRMLMRGDLWHEVICSAGRDRIMKLSLEIEGLKREHDAYVATAQEEYAALEAELAEALGAAGHKPPARASKEQLQRCLSAATIRVRHYEQAMRKVLEWASPGSTPEKIILDALAADTPVVESPVSNEMLAWMRDMVESYAGMQCDQIAVSNVSVADWRKLLAQAERGAAVEPPALHDDPAVLREYLRVYGGHIPPCAGRPCECGFQKAWEVADLPSTIATRTGTDKSRVAPSAEVGADPCTGQPPSAIQMAMALISEVDCHLANAKWDKGATARRKLHQAHTLLGPTKPATQS